MSANLNTSYPRIIGKNAHRYIGKNVSIIGEVISITTNANTVTMRLSDDENIYVLLQKNSTTVEPNLLTEVYGKMVSRGSIEAVKIKQWTAKETAMFNRSLQAEACDIYEAHRLQYDLWISFETM